MAEVSMETGLLDTPDEILFEIFRRLPKDKLIDISRLCSKFRQIAGDTRNWKNVIVSHQCYDSTYFAFEELYSGPWPVKIIDMEQIEIKPPVSPSKSDQVVKANTLNLSSITADNATLEAILAKYQCTELHLDCNSVDLQGRIKGIAPEAFSRQTALEVLSLRGMALNHLGMREGKPIPIKIECHEWLVPVLDNCKNLKSLCLSFTVLGNSDLLDFVKNLPPSLEKLFLGPNAYPEDFFFKLLSESTPNLRELELSPTRINYPSLLKLEFLEVLHVIPYGYRDISNLYMYLKKLPKLKAVYIDKDNDLSVDKETQQTNLGKLRTMLEPHGVIVGQVVYPERSPYPVDDNLFRVVKAPLKTTIGELKSQQLKPLRACDKFLDFDQDARIDENEEIYWKDFF